MAKLTSFTAGYGVTLVRGDNEWHKFNCEVTLDLEEGDNSAQVKQKAWNTVYDEVEKQIRELNVLE